MRASESSDRMPTEPREAVHLLARVDHLIYGTPDLEVGIDRLERLLGVRATPGGQHSEWGTRNALIALGPRAYLEIIGPDPEEPRPKAPRPFGVDDLESPRLVAWAAGSDDLEQLANRARALGIHLGEVMSGARRRPDGMVLSWRYTNPRAIVAEGVVPFFIDWAATPHPADTAAAGAALIGLRAEHADAGRVRQILEDLGIEMAVASGPAPALIATVAGPRGRVELR